MNYENFSQHFPPIPDPVCLMRQPESERPQGNGSPGRHRKKIHAPPYTSHAEHSRIACGLSGTALLGQYGFYRHHLYQPSGCYGTSMGGLYRYPEDSAGHYCDSCHKANV